MSGEQIETIGSPFYFWTKIWNQFFGFFGTPFAVTVIVLLREQYERVWWLVGLEGLEMDVAGQPFLQLSHLV